MNPEELPEDQGVPADRTDGPGVPSRESSSLPDAKDKVPKYTGICPGACYSLRDAALLLAVPEGTLRRAILLEAIPAQEASDDRHYLIQGSSLLAYVRRLRPEEQPLEPGGEGVPWAVALLALLPVLAAILLLVGVSRPSTPQRPTLPSPGPGVEAGIENP